MKKLSIILLLFCACKKNDSTNTQPDTTVPGAHLYNKLWMYDNAGKQYIDSSTNQTKEPFGISGSTTYNKDNNYYSFSLSNREIKDTGWVPWIKQKEPAFWISINGTNITDTGTYELKESGFFNYLKPAGSGLLANGVYHILKGSTVHISYCNKREITGTFSLRLNAQIEKDKTKLTNTVKGGFEILK